MTRTSLFRGWLLVSGLGWTAAGVALAVVSFFPGALDAGNRLVLPDAAPSTTVTGLLCAITGGLTTGLGVIFMALARADLTRAGAVLRAVAWGVVTWYLVDSTASVLHGGWRNAVSNTVAFLGAAVPLFWLATYEGRAERGDSTKPSQ